MDKKTLVIINNEKVFKKDNDFYCRNLDLKVFPETLSLNYKIHYIARKSNKEGKQKINLKNIKLGSNIFQYIYLIFQTFKIPNVSYFIFSITPYTFCSFLILFLFRKKIFVYLISSGHEEYKYILGSWAVWIYHIMYKMVTSNSTVIVLHERLSRKKNSHVIVPSRLDDQWLKNHKKALLDKIRLLYVGRINPEKGIYEFIKMFEQLKLNAKLSIVGEKKNLNFLNKNINFVGYISDTQELINIYDNHNIVILPSYTEAYPYVIDESLARKRPAIIFEDIAYIVKDKKGIFISKRDINSLTQTLQHVINNYEEIQKNIEKNTLPARNDMLKQVSDIIGY